MKVESSVTSLSWIPSEAVVGLPKYGFEAGVTHYDEPLPDSFADVFELERWREADLFRFGNRLTGWIEVDGAQIVAHGQDGGGVIGSTTLRLGRRSVTFAGFILPDLRPAPEVGPSSVTFRQTVGGCSGLPAPRPVRHKPFVQYRPPTVWTTLALTIHADGHADHALEGASAFPRHWVYGPDGALAAKSGLTDFKGWFTHSYGERTPWGDHDSPAMVVEVESALERALSSQLMRTGSAEVSKRKAGDTLWQQGDEGSTVALLLDGVLEVIVDGEPVATLGPGALIGERALLEGGRRTATLRAETPVRIAEVGAEDLDLDVDALSEVSRGHRREDRAGS